MLAHRIRRPDAKKGLPKLSGLCTCRVGDQTLPWRLKRLQSFRSIVAYRRSPDVMVHGDPPQSASLLGIFLMAETFSLMTAPKQDHLANLFRINRAIAAGLGSKAGKGQMQRAA